MSRVLSIQKRKVKKAYGYLLLSVGIFCGVLALCIGTFLFSQNKSILKSPLATVGITHGNTTQTQQVEVLCSKYNLVCDNIQQSGDTISFTVNSSTIYISTTKDMEQELDSLQLTIRQLTMEGKEFHRLDFRFDRPVISN